MFEHSLRSPKEGPKQGFELCEEWRGLTVLEHRFIIPLYKYNHSNVEGDSWLGTGLIVIPPLILNLMFYDLSYIKLIT